jgi:hypothetical protein
VGELRDSHLAGSQRPRRRLADAILLGLLLLPACMGRGTSGVGSAVLGGFYDPGGRNPSVPRARYRGHGGGTDRAGGRRSAPAPSDRCAAEGRRARHITREFEDPSGRRAPPTAEPTPAPRLRPMAGAGGVVAVSLVAYLVHRRRARQGPLVRTLSRIWRPEAQHGARLRGTVGDSLPQPRQAGSHSDRRL